VATSRSAGIQQARIARSCLGHAPRFQDVTAWISKREVTRFKFYLLTSMVAGTLIVFALHSRLSRAAKAIPATPAPETAPVPEFHSALVAAIRAGKPLALRKALFAACAYASGHTFVQPQGGYADEIQLLNERERLLLHLIAARISALECAAVLGCTEPYVYAMRSRIRAKLSLDSETTLEDTLQRWETSYW
jgi:DNA-binding CsgD family transcriptional regulator